MISSFSASNPVCNYTVSNSKNGTDEHHLVLQCSVSFRGSWAPVMEWRIGTRDQVITDGVDNHTVFNRSVTYTLNVNVSQEMCGTIFTCTTKFVEHMRPPYTDATNVPSYNHTWIYSFGDLYCASRLPYPSKYIPSIDNWMWCRISLKSELWIQCFTWFDIMCMGFNCSPNNSII